MMFLLDKFPRLWKFCVVGAIGTCVNMVFLYILTEYAHLFYLFSGCIAIELSIISNFLLNDNWTFKQDNRRPFLQRLIAYETISAIAVAIQIVLLYIFTDIFHIYYLISSLLSIPLTFSWNFLMNKYVTWKNKL